MAKCAAYPLICPKLFSSSSMPCTSFSSAPWPSFSGLLWLLWARIPQAIMPAIMARNVMSRSPFNTFLIVLIFIIPHKIRCSSEVMMLWFEFQSQNFATTKEQKYSPHKKKRFPYFKRTQLHLRSSHKKSIDMRGNMQQRKNSTSSPSTLTLKTTLYCLIYLSNFIVVYYVDIDGFN